MSRNGHLTLLRREFWEHRSLWIWPVAVAGLFAVVGALVAAFGEVRVQAGPGPGGVRNLSPGRGLPPGMSAMDIGVVSVASQIVAVAAIVGFFYLLDCLYAERKDRSILFWKSLPVSDTATVLSKAAVGLVLAPLLGYLVALVAYPVIHGIGALSLAGLATVTGGWNTADWLRAELSLLLAVLATILWYAPLAAWAMLASALSKRSPIITALLPIAAIALCENILLRSGHAWQFIGRRLSPVVDPAEGIGRPALWLGVAAAAGILYVVIRLRRYRDDT